MTDALLRRIQGATEFETLVAKAMSDAWNDICSDTSCHPDDLTHRGRYLEFTPNHWASLTSGYLRAALLLAQSTPAQADNPHRDGMR